MTDAETDRWSWLADTYWYVPAETLPAIMMLAVRDPRTITVQDQTLWHFERCEAGYLIGRAALSVNGGDFSYSTIVGSVTPDGSVCLSFASEGGVTVDPRSGAEVPPLTIGWGRMAPRDGGWAFLMQMTAGHGAASLTHWSWMVRSSPEDASWTEVPGMPGISIGEVFA